MNTVVKTCDTISSKTTRVLYFNYTLRNEIKINFIPEVPIYFRKFAFEKSDC